MNRHDAMHTSICFDGTDRWTRSARRVQHMAAAAGRDVDSESLIHYDMRDLQTLELALRQELRKRDGDARRGSVTLPLTVLAVALAALTPLVAPSLLLAMLLVVTG